MAKIDVSLDLRRLLLLSPLALLAIAFVRPLHPV